MSIRRNIFLFAWWLPLSVIAQHTGIDTVTFTDTYAKSGEQYTIQTVVDTANTIVINELLARNSDLNFDEHGDDDDWFELYNFGDEPVLLNRLWFTDDPSTPLKWKIDTTDDIYLEPGEYFIVWADDEPWEGSHHANFKISGDGEYLGIYTSDLQEVDQVVFPEQTPNISYGRSNNSELNWVFLNTPTPGSKNDSSSGGIVLPAPIFSKPGGVYTTPLNIQIYTMVQGAEIRYNLNAENPTLNSTLYEGPIQIDSTTVLRAALFKEGDLTGPTHTSTFFIGDNNYTNARVSIVATPDDLYGSHGLIETNSSAIEIPAHFEYMVNGQTLYASGTGIQLHAANSSKPTSMRFYARSRYGNDWFGYPFFADQAPYYFKRLVFRNSGNDNVYNSGATSHFRDLLIHEIARRSLKNPLVAAGKPVNVFLNGAYFGLFNMRERIDQFYIETHMGITNDYDLIERAFGFPGNMNPIAGSFENWDMLMAYVDTIGDPYRQEYLDFVTSQVDLVNFTEYWMTEVFVGNFDWLSNNVKLWKSEDGRWQWIFWDLDHGLGLKYNQYGIVAWNTLEWSLTFNDRTWPNGYNNMLIRNLLENQKYRDWFIRKFATMLNSSFSFTSTEPVFDSISALYENDMPYHISRWNSNMDNWWSACDTIKTYLEKRPEIVFRHLEQFFGLEEAVGVKLNVIPEGAGSIYWAEEEIPTHSMEGKYFPGISYKIDAEAIPGFRLARWTLNGERADLDSIDLSGPTEINAYFEPVEETPPIQITEFYTNNRQICDCGDWIEFLYYGYQSIDLSGAELLDNDDQVLFRFKEGTVIEPGTYFVVVEDELDFEEIFPASVVIAGELAMEFNGNPQIRLRLADGVLVGPVDFMNSPSWPTLPAEGFSIELRQPVYDPRQGSNWELSHNRFGSPGISNSQFYDFHPPTGKDSIFSNKETALIRFGPEDAFYADQDGHKLMGIRVVSREGPGEFFCEGIPVRANSILPPEDLYFEPAQPYIKASRLEYRLIDRSGAMSENYSLEFLPETEVWQKLQSGWKLYPNPAKDHLIIESETAFLHSGSFVILDITGKQILTQKVQAGTNRLTVGISSLQPGIYIYTMETAGNRLHGKFEVIR